MTLVQSSLGHTGNFELVTSNPTAGNRGFTHRFRNNDDAALPWVFAGQFFRPDHVVRHPTLHFDRRTRSLHVLAAMQFPDGSQGLGYVVRGDGPGWTWALPQRLPGTDPRDLGGPAVLLPRAGGGLDVFAPRADAGIRRLTLELGGWRDRGVTLASLGRVDAITGVNGSLGAIELVVRRGTQLHHVRLTSAGWSTPVRIADGATGGAAVIQSRFGARGNLELVFADTAGGLGFAFCDSNTLRWSDPVRVLANVGTTAGGDPDDTVVGLVQSNFGTPGRGNLEVVLQRGGACWFTWRQDVSPWRWAPPLQIAEAVVDGPTVLRGPGRLSDRLAADADLRRGLLWQTGTGGLRNYDEWTQAQRDRLDALERRLREAGPDLGWAQRLDLGLRCPDVAANLSLRRRPDGPRCLFLTADEAFDLYAAHVAHAFALEATGAVSWSIVDLPASERHELLSAPRYHSIILPDAPGLGPEPYYPAHIRPGRDYQLPARVQTTGGPMGLCCDPRVGYWFLRGLARERGIDLIASTEAQTLANLIAWVSQNLGHGGDGTDSTDAYFIAHAELRDRLRGEHRDFPGGRSWTGLFAPSGCHSAANLLHDLARSVNIPLLVAGVSASGLHAGLLFRWNRTDPRICHHVDDAYIANGLVPCFPVDDAGVALGAAATARVVFDILFAPPLDLSRFGFRHSADYEPWQRAAFDAPDLGSRAGYWPTIDAMAAHTLEHRVRMASWRRFLEELCPDFLTEADLLRFNGGFLLMPFAEVRAQADAAHAAAGGCDALRAAVDAWTAASGRDTWVDRRP